MFVLIVWLDDEYDMATSIISPFAFHSQKVQRADDCIFFPLSSSLRVEFLPEIWSDVKEIDPS